MENEQNEAGTSVETTPIITAEISEYTSDVNEEVEQLSPEYLQRKLYFLLDHLKKMHSELPE